MYYNDFYDTDIVNTAGGIDQTWLLISAILAIVGGIVAYILFVSKKNKENLKDLSNGYMIFLILENSLLKWY